MKSFLSNLFHKKQHSDPVRQAKKKWQKSDWWLIILTFALSLIGLLMVYDSSVAIAIRDFADPYHFVRDQSRWLIIGFTAFLALSVIDYHLLYKIALPALIGEIVLLLLVFVPGVGITALGAHRWINLRFTVIQPAELAKLVLTIYLSAWFSFPEKNRLISFLLLLAMVVGLVIAEPDLGTAIIILSIAILIYFVSGAPLWQFGLMIPVLSLGLILLAVISPYRLNRLTSFFNPAQDPLGSSYQVRQATIALGSGGWTGVGIGKSRQKYEYLPEANTDSIYAIIGEETGFLGAGSLIFIYLLLVWRGFRLAKRAPDQFGKILAIGISSWIAIQFGINAAANVALLPLTGVPLPLISYGGSSLVIVLAALGILANISRQS